MELKRRDFMKTVSCAVRWLPAGAPSRGRDIGAGRAR